MQIKWIILYSAFDTKITQCEHVSKKEERKKFTTIFQLILAHGIWISYKMLEKCEIFSKEQARAVARIEKINKNRPTINSWNAYVTEKFFEEEEVEENLHSQYQIGTRYIILDLTKKLFLHNRFTVNQTI